MVNTGKFQKYDFGVFDNLDEYGSSIPDEIDITKIRTPVAMYVGLSDALGDPTDNQAVKYKLGGKVVAYEELDHDHLSLVFGKNLTYFNETLALIESYWITSRI